MATLLELSAARRDNAGLLTIPVVRLPPGCKGHACPAFALCQGRCETKRAEREARDGYPGGLRQAG